MIFPADASQKASSNEDSLTEPHFNYDAFPQLKSADGTGRIQGYLIDTCQCDEATHGRDLYELERELEAITMDEVFFESIRRNLKEKLETHLNRSQEGVGMRTKKLFVNDVLAWNNEEYCMRMLKQSFVHRKSEYMVNFKVCDLLAGSRHLFNDPGNTFSITLSLLFMNTYPFCDRPFTTISLRNILFSSPP